MARLYHQVGQGLPFWILLGHLPIGLSLTLPTATPSDHHNIPRSPEEPVATKYGFFDSYGGMDNSDTPMPHVADVFQAMAQHSISATHTSESVESDSSSATATATASFTVSTPPMHGPGLVILTSPIFPDLGSPTTMPVDPTLSPPSANESSDHAGLTKHTTVVLGSVVGAILLFILCLSFLIVPSFARKVFCCSWRSRKKPLGIMNTPEDKEKGSNGQSSPGTNSTPGTPNPGDRTLVNSPNTADAKTGKVEDSTGEFTHHLPASKFSICSSDYLTSSRNSEVSLVSSPYAVKPSVTFAPSSTPTRPPRPPTTDSPALSESVYLACADKNYMIVTPEPLSGEDEPVPRKRHLTPSEFLALHVPGILAGFSLSSTATTSSTSSPADTTDKSSKKLDRVSAIAESTKSQRSINSRRNSRHSRTKSAPMLGPAALGSKKKIVNHPGVTNGGDDEETQALNAPPPLAGTLNQSFLMKHRRSRSASGWAYPDRPRTRK